MKLQKEFGLSYRAEATGERLSGQIRKFVKLASGRFAVLQKGKEFSLVPWREVMRVRKGRGLGIEVGKGVSR